jgi:hypothetical protein
MCFYYTPSPFFRTGAIVCYFCKILWRFVNDAFRLPPAAAQGAKNIEAVKPLPIIQESKTKHFQNMGLCPIAPPKGFPLALWKPSGKKS